MKLNVRELQQIMGYLRNVAEVDPDDSIANRASDLAYRLESAGTSRFDMSMNFTDWSPLHQALVRYAISKREQYVLAPGAKHAKNLALEVAI